MASTKDIKRRQKSVKNTKQVTRAVGMVAAAKMRKAQLTALQSRPYAQHAQKILARIKQRQPDIRNLFLDGRDTKKILAIVLTSDKGLCGGLNSAVIRESHKLFEQYKKDGREIELVLIGLKSKSSFQKMDLPLMRAFNGTGDYVELEQTKPIAEYIREQFRTSEFSKVIAVYTEFISTLKQKVVRRQILPIREEIFEDLLNDITPETGKYSGQKTAKQKGEEAGNAPEYIFEPNAEAVLENLIPFLIDIYIYHIILESNASEHSARMVAMKNATDNAENILHQLTLSYNKARQAAITREITEITAGVEALK